MSSDDVKKSLRTPIAIGLVMLVLGLVVGVGAGTVLNAAAWTYVAAFLTSLVYFLWYLAPLLGGTRRD